MNAGTTSILTVSPWPVGRDSAMIARVHLRVREWQVAVGENEFPDIMDSQPDLMDVGGAYILPGGQFWVARLGGYLTGFVGLQRGPTGFMLKRMAVLPEFQGQGVGSRLLAALTSWADEREVPRVDLLTGVRERGRALYERHGWVVTGFVAASQDWAMARHHSGRRG